MQGREFRVRNEVIRAFGLGHTELLELRHSYPMSPTPNIDTDQSLALQKIQVRSVLENLNV